MKRLPLLIFMLLCFSAVFIGYGSYKDARQIVRSDLDQALQKTVAGKGFANMRQDSIKAYKMLAKRDGERMTIIVNDDTLRRYLHIAELRNKAYIAYTIVSDQGQLKVDFHSNANCSVFMLFSISDQRLSLTLSIIAMFWLFYSFFRFRPKQFTELDFADVSIANKSTDLTSRCPSDANVYGGLWFDSTRQMFLTIENAPLHLTPMQRQLMEMFFSSSSHRLTIQEICDTLWPKKEDANETLYTLIRRLRKELKTCSSLHIESDRGRAYELKDNCQ